MTYTGQNTDAEKGLVSAVVYDTQDLFMVDKALHRYIVHNISILLYTENIGNEEKAFL
jgi:hypothetical protein